MQLLTKWNDFSGGEAGWIDKSKIQPSFYTGEQVVTYRDGSVGPRCGVLDLSSGSGLPGGTLNNMGYVNITGANPEKVWVFKGVDLVTLVVYDSNGVVQTGQSWQPVTGSFALSPTSSLCDYVDVEPGRTRFTVNNDKSYTVDWTAGTPVLTALTGSPGGRAIEQFGSYLVVAGSNANPNRVRWSLAGDHGQWPAGNFLDLGPTNDGASTIIAMRALREMLVCWTNTGEIFIITAPGGNLDVTGGPIIRQYLYADRGTCPGQADAIVRVRDGSTWWTRREEVPFQQDQVVDAPSAVPVSFDGTQRQEYPLLGGYLRQPNFSVERRSLTSGFAGRSARNFGLADTAQRVLLQREGAWSRHHLGTIHTKRLALGLRGEVFGMDTGFTKLMAWVFELDRPPWSFAGSSNQKIPYNVADAASAIAPPPWFATPEFRFPDYSMMSVQRVEVIFTAYDTRDATNSHVDCFVQQYDRTDAVEVLTAGSAIPPDSETSGTAMIAGGTTIGATTSFDIPAPARPTRYRVAFYMAADNLPAPAVRVLLRGLRGVAVHEIAVYGDIIKQVRP